jgi:large subunit ribosomal protein L3
MIDTLLAIKKGMTSGYDARGRRVGATILQVSPNFVTQIKSQEKDGYQAVQLGISSKKSVRKPQLGHLKKANIEQSLRWMREVKAENSDDLEPGKQINVSQVFSRGDVVKVTGTSKGRGFAGGVKRYNFQGGPKTHGQSDRHRAPGSSGSGTTPGRVFKGHRGPGHYGVDTVSYLNLEVIGVDLANNFLFVKGGVPGANGGLIMVKNMGKLKGYTPPPEEKPSEEEELEAEGKEHTEEVSAEASQEVETQATLEAENNQEEVKE